MNEAQETSPKPTADVTPSQSAAASITPCTRVRILRVIGRLLLAAFALSIILVLALRWLAPPVSAFMLARWFEGVVHAERRTPIHYKWVDWNEISLAMPLAVIAAEDQKFLDHHGFDLESISTQLEKKAAGKRVRGASTISQQVAKNLFLWSGRSYVRKGLEAYFTVLIELLWSKQRILEVYVNIAEFGDGMYGVAAAAETFFGKPAAKLTQGDAARLAAVLPNPKRLKVENPSSYQVTRRRWIERQMRQLGGTEYLKNMR